jgi:hypothetical protein
MRVLYVASKSLNETELNLTREVTELQRRFGREAGERVEFRVLPDLKLEDLPNELSSFRPEILHIASHADTESLSLADQEGNPVQITAEILSAFLPPGNPPRLVYLNSCNSQQIAKELVDTGSVVFSIGSTAPISNRVARNSAGAFYERLVAGYSLEHAFQACRNMLRAITACRADAVLFQSLIATPKTEIMHRVPMLIADFEDLVPAGSDGPTKGSGYDIRLGLAGCPTSTIQVIFFTDDQSYFADEDTLEEDLCLVTRASPVRGIVLAPEGGWNAEGDHRLFAVGVLAGGGCFSVSGTLCEAIENRYRYAGQGEIPPIVMDALVNLRAEDGAESIPNYSNSTSGRNPQKKGEVSSGGGPKRKASRGNAK